VVWVHMQIVTVAGTIPPEQWNRLGTRLIPKMRAVGTVTATIRLDIEIDQTKSATLASELRQIIEETSLSGTVRIENGFAEQDRRYWVMPRRSSAHEYAGGSAGAGSMDSSWAGLKGAAGIFRVHHTREAGCPTYRAQMGPRSIPAAAPLR
jgi:hypothetical protein